MNRRRRFRREEPIPMQVTPRDIAILDAVARHRFLDSRQITQSLGGSAQHVLRRLQKLFHAGYLDRPLSQVFYQDKTRPIIYEIGRVGRKLLSDSSDARRVVKKPVGRFYMEHTLLIAAISLLFRQGDGSTKPRVVFREDRPEWPEKWQVGLREGKGTARVPICPDLTLEVTASDGRPLLLFVEADRGTMPIVRRSLGQTSFMRKLLAYEGTWAQRLTRKSHDIARFRVLTVTRTLSRARKLAQACEKLPGGRGLFLFTDIASLQKSADPFRHEWISGRGGADRIFGV